MKFFKKPKIRLNLNWSTILGGWAIRLIYFTNRYRIRGDDYYQSILAKGKSVIVAVWHGRLLAPFMYMAGNDYFALAGTHRDAEIISRIGQKIGWRFVRGSSSERGRKAYKQLLQVLNVPGTLLYITPDGPKGPAKIPKPGVIRAAQATGTPIVPVASHSTRFRGFTNWDTFIVAKTFARSEIIYGEPLYFNREMSYEECTALITAALNKLEQEVDERCGH